MSTVIPEPPRTTHLVRAARLVDVESASCLPVYVEGRVLALFSHGGQVYAVDNRCPHMGVPPPLATIRP